MPKTTKIKKTNKKLEKKNFNKLKKYYSHNNKEINLYVNNKTVNKIYDGIKKNNVVFFFNHFALINI